MLQGLKTVKEVKTKITELLSGLYDESEAKSITDILLEHFLQITRTQLILQANDLVESVKISQTEKALNRLLDHEPLQYVIGYTYFSGIKFYVDKNVLIPRPETEELLFWLLDEPAIKSSSVNIVDIGTGSGCIAIAIKKKLSNAHVFGIDVSEKALDIATSNALANNLNIDFIKADIHKWRSINELPSPIHYIIANPPYIRNSEKQSMYKNVVDHEPHLALFVDDADPLLFYKTIADFALNKLNAEGKLFLEVNRSLANDVVDLLKTKGFSTVELRKDISGNDRMIRATR